MVAVSSSFVIECRDDLRLNLEAMDALIRARLVSTQQLDAHLAHALEAGNYSLLGLALQLLQVWAASAHWCKVVPPLSPT